VSTALAPDPADATAAPSARPDSRFPELQGQRGLAALLIVLFHVYQYDRSGPDGRYPLEDSPLHPLLVGLDGTVDWFFVLSAFLLTLPYARALRDGRPLTTARDFLGRRAVRIVPLYLVAVLIVWVTRNPRLPGDWRDLLEHLTFTQVYDEQRIFFTIGPAWSLAVEVQFYVLIALFGALLSRTAARAATPARRLAPLAAGTAVLLLVSGAWWLVLGVAQDRPAVQYVLWFGLPAKLGVFAVGMAAALVVALVPRALGRAATWSLRGAGVATFLLTAHALVERESGARDWLFHLLCGLAFALVVVAGALGRPRGSWHRLSARGVLPWVGLVSYSLYLWHEPLLLHLAGNGLLPAPSPSAFLPSAAIVVPLALLTAWISYWLVEHPSSHLRVFLSAVPSRELVLERRRAL
jgi:peptidoglycan/LPS O-acetylase OafA/YrhL